jgi:general stress protein CsbA
MIITGWACLSYADRSFAGEGERSVESYALKIILALFLPAALVVLFTRVTYHHVVGLILTVALIAASVYAGYTHTWLLYAIDALSLTAGFYIAGRMREQAKHGDRDPS